MLRFPFSKITGYFQFEFRSVLWRAGKTTDHTEIRPSTYHRGREPAPHAAHSAKNIYVLRSEPAQTAEASAHDLVINAMRMPAVR